MGERRDLGEVQSAPCADNSAAFAAAKRQIKISGKVRENAEGSAASKADLMRDSDALLTLVGSIIHGYHEYWGNFLTKQLYKVPVQSRFTRYLTHPLTINIWNYPPKLFRIGINAELLLLMRRPNIDERRERDVLHILLCRTFEQN
jgi:hypothetical protein